MIVLCGKSCSGKDRIRSELVSLGYNKIITYTTRPPRDKEEDGKDYNFLSDEDFSKLESDGFFAEVTSYNTANGIYKYGTSIESVINSDSNTVIILNPDGVKAFKTNDDIKNKIVVFYLDVSDKMLLERSNNRDKNKLEAQRRFEADKRDFKDICSISDMLIRNENIEPNLVANMIDWSYKRLIKGAKNTWLK